MASAGGGGLVELGKAASHSRSVPLDRAATGKAEGGEFSNDYARRANAGVGCFLGCPIRGSLRSHGIRLPAASNRGQMDAAPPRRRHYALPWTRAAGGNWLYRARLASSGRQNPHRQG